MAKKLSILELALRALPIAILATQAKQPTASRKVKQKAVSEAIDAATQLTGDLLNPKQRKAVNAVRDATVDALKATGVFKQDEAPKL